MNRRTVTVASHAGFCFGVKRATEAVEELLRSGTGGKIYTLGKLIHNDGYNESLRSRGVGEISSSDLDKIESAARSGERITVVVRAHGEIKETLDRLSALDAELENFTLIDCTCPYVRKVRRIAEENSGEGMFFMLLGAKEHPEVRGIMSCLRGDGAVFADADEFEKWAYSHNDEKDAEKLGNLRISIAAQTTQNLNEWKKTLKIAKKVYTNPFIFDTICNVTEERQTEAERLAGESDAVVVIGSASSSNTGKLCDICRRACPRTYLIEDARGLHDLSLPESGRISVTAGASTPLSVIQEVEQTMNEQITENFEEMLDASMKTLNPGDVVVGVITSISQNEIHLDLGAKTTGVIVHEKLTDDPSAKLDELFKVGDEIKAKVIKVSDIEGIAMLDKTRVDSDGNWLAIVDACNSGEILEGKIVDAVKGGIIATVKSVRIFIPASLSGLPKGCSDDDLRALVGTTQKFKVIEIKEERKRALGSIRAVQREERRAKEAEFWAQVEVGQIYEGEVKSLTNYGAFVDLGGGVDGMVHMSELSWRRIRHPSEVVAVGDVIKVFVKGVDKEKKRISLGYKTEESDPWYIFTHKYSLGDVAKVKIVSLMQFGAFAEVVPGADGLIHISQITDHKIASPAEVLHVGDEVDAKIVGIDNDNRKISLSIRALIEPKEEPAEEAATEEEAAPAVFSTDNPEAYADFGVEAGEKAEEVKEEVEEKAEKAPVEEKVEAVKEAVEEKIEAAAEKAEEIKEAVAEKIEEVKEAVAEKAEKVKKKVADKIEEVKGSDE